MNTNEEMLTDISAELDKEFGAPGTPERASVCVLHELCFIG